MTSCVHLEQLATADPPARTPNGCEECLATGSRWCIYERVTRMRHKLGALASGKLDGATLHDLTAVQDEAIERLPKAPKLTPMQTSDAEDEISDWLDAHDIDGGWELAPTPPQPCHPDHERPKKRC